MLDGLTSLRPAAAARAVVKLFANPEETEHVFDIIEALRGPSLHRLRARLRRTDRGRRLLADRPDLLRLLCNRDALAALPAGTLGRAYLDFVDAEGITADGLVQASRRVEPDVDPELEWVRSWLRDSHNLWHTVLGYRGDLVGEAALLAFSHTETGNLGVGLIAAVAWVKLGRETAPELGAQDAVAEGRKLARRAAWFVDVPWHRWLDRPLDEVRRELEVVRPVSYHPIRASEIDTSLAPRVR